MWKALYSRNFAVYALLLLVVLLVVSAFLPNGMTVTEKEWYTLQQQSPLYFAIASRFSTPYLVKTPFFAVVSFLLFLSILACTVERVRTWLRLHVSDFSKEKAFSFSVDSFSGRRPDVVNARIDQLLTRGGWGKSRGETDGIVVITGQKGTSGFWGSVIFHVGLLFCFIAGPVTALTAFRGEMVITEGMDVPIRSVVAGEGNMNPMVLPDVNVMVHHLRGMYYQGRFKSDFGGALTIRDGSSFDHPFAVNNPLNYRGFQFSLHQFGYAPKVIIERDGQPLFDYYLNLRHSQEGDWFELPGGLRALVMFLPDFIREGGKIGTASQEARNPVIMVKLFRADKEVFKGLLKPGETAAWDGMNIRVPDYRHWVNLVVTREHGLQFAIIGFLLGMIGLLVRFLSNERRLEFEIGVGAGMTKIRVRGYSRYYPAFLEKEVQTMAQTLSEEIQQ